MLGSTGASIDYFDVIIKICAGGCILRGFRIRGLEFGTWVDFQKILGCGEELFGNKVDILPWVWGLGFRIWRLGLRAQGVICTVKESMYSPEYLVLQSRICKTSIWFYNRGFARRTPLSLIDPHINRDWVSKIEDLRVGVYPF
jgi:hypothetical protein